MTDRPQDVVGRGYDAAADEFAEWQQKITGSTRLDRLEELLLHLPDRPDVLELGSGAGVHSTRILAERTNLVGVDISAAQVSRARGRVPGAVFVLADFTDLDFPPASFDAVVAFYVMNHVPREEYAALLGRVATWLRPGGFLLSTFGASDLPAWRGPWEAIGGRDSFFSGYDPPVTLRLIADAGLELARHDLETMEEPEGPVTFLWVLARR